MIQDQNLKTVARFMLTGLKQLEELIILPDRTGYLWCAYCGKEGTREKAAHTEQCPLAIIGAIENMGGIDEIPPRGPRCACCGNAADSPHYCHNCK